MSLNLCSNSYPIEYCVLSNVSKPGSPTNLLVGIFPFGFGKSVPCEGRNSIPSPLLSSFWK